MARSIGFARNALCLIGVLLLLALPDLARAQVVAFGASNVAGKGVSPSEAYPAQLEAMLRAKGLKVWVRNAGLSGDTSAGMLARLDQVLPRGTKVVILDSSGEFHNDWKYGVSQEQGHANLAEMVSRLQARGITVIQESTHDIPMSYRQADGKHLTPEGHRIVAARLVDQVAGALGH